MNIAQLTDGHQTDRRILDGWPDGTGRPGYILPPLRRAFFDDEGKTNCVTEYDRVNKY